MHWLARHLARFGAAGALLASFCCLGFSALVSLLSAVGLGFLVNDAILFPALAVSLALNVVGLVAGWRRHRKVIVMTLGIAAAAANLTFIVVMYTRPLAYAAVAAMVLASVWDLVERRKAMGRASASR